MSDTLLTYIDLDGTLDGLLHAPHWYVGVSGGVDSTALLHLLRAWQKNRDDTPTLTAIHVNHGMQPAAAEWQSHCEQLCREWGVPFISRAVEVGSRGSREAAARRARYAVFRELMQPGGVMFLGHHLDDQVETFFLRLMRGAGVDGLAAMPKIRAMGECLLARPLLDVTRQSLEQYAACHGLQCVDDPSNSDTMMDRNFLRSQLLPLLASRWPSYRQTVVRASGHMATTAGVLQDQLGVPKTVFSALDDSGLELRELTAVSSEIAALKLRAWLQASGCQPPDQSAMGEFLRQLQEADTDSSARMNCSAYILQRYREGVYLLPKQIGATLPQRDLHMAPDEYHVVPGVGGLRLCRATGEGLLLGAGEQVQVSWRQGGERCRPQGRAASTSLKKLLQEWEVPPWWRDRIPLVYLDGELLAVGDLVLCESSRWRASASAEDRLWCLSWDRAVDSAGA